jgi:hypothetical protein
MKTVMKIVEIISYPYPKRKRPPKVPVKRAVRIPLYNRPVKGDPLAF